MDHPYDRIEWHAFVATDWCRPLGPAKQMKKLHKRLGKRKRDTKILRTTKQQTTECGEDDDHDGDHDKYKRFRTT